MVAFILRCAAPLDYHIAFLTTKISVRCTFAYMHLLIAKNIWMRCNFVYIRY